MPAKINSWSATTSDNGYVVTAQTTTTKSGKPVIELSSALCVYDAQQAGQMVDAILQAARQLDWNMDTIRNEIADQVLMKPKTNFRGYGGDAEALKRELSIADCNLKDILQATFDPDDFEKEMVDQETRQDKTRPRRPRGKS